ncbi:YcaO-like family protein [Streptomyces sp. A012304]|uniref:YcaO-like family protein n=1 Tax=Streptomyces sp. A012304 TaxID=375446 RepID=UPI00280298A3|nr:YcaO-like family protein [Streptomyces sp. A012304]GKQ38456.1 hypothetical protein ALMP_49870 [Streptomyces sp. A012304]
MAAGMALEIALVDGPYGLPVWVAYPWSEDYPVVFADGGCHSRPAIALIRALTETVVRRRPLRPRPHRSGPPPVRRAIGEDCPAEVAAPPARATGPCWG